MSYTWLSPRLQPLATTLMGYSSLALLLAVPLTTLLLSGCQSTREHMLGEGYPLAFVDGFDAGCSSGRKAAGSLDTFRKDVPRYLQDKLYAGGWEDGFRQCHGQLEAEIERDLHKPSERDREWRHHVQQSMGQALRQK